MSLTSYGTVLIKLFNIFRLLLYCFPQTGENAGREECSESNFRYNKEITIRGELLLLFLLGQSRCPRQSEILVSKSRI